MTGGFDDRPPYLEDPELKLHDAPYAPNPLTVRLFIAERGGVALDVEAVDLIGLENRSLAFRAINPAGTVPALALDDGRVLSDIVAICEYLDEVASGESLIGTTPEARALTRMWTRRGDLEVAQPFVARERRGGRLLPRPSPAADAWPRGEQATRDARAERPRRPP